MTRAATQEEKWDRDRDLAKHEPRASGFDERTLRVAYLTAYLDTLLRLNRIPDDVRDGVRRSVDNTRKAFDLPSLGAPDA